MSEGPKEFGKFDSAAALYKAYRSLESEFTKRNQELSKQREENNRLSERLQNVLQDEEFIERAALDKAVAARAVQNFLSARAEMDTVPVLKSGFGQTAVAMPNKPKTLEEAKVLAEQLLK